MYDQEQNNEIRNKLLKLPRIKAKSGFENELMKRINSLPTLPLKTDTDKNFSVLDFITGKSGLNWIIPAMSLSIIAIIVIMITVFNTRDVEQNESGFTQESIIKKDTIIQDGGETTTIDKPEKDNTNGNEIDNKSEDKKTSPKHKQLTRKQNTGSDYADLISSNRTEIEETKLINNIPIKIESEKTPDTYPKEKATVPPSAMIKDIDEKKSDGGKSTDNLIKRDKRNFNINPEVLELLHKKIINSKDIKK